MAKTAIQIVREAYSYAGIVFTNGQLDDRKSAEGLDFLNELLYRWNIENYFPFTNNTIDGTVQGGEAKIFDAPEATFRGEKPLHVNKVLWKDCNEWVPLVPLGYENIWERRSCTTNPTFYAFTNDEEGNGVLTFDCENGNFQCRVIYNKALPKMDFNDVLAAPEQYEQLLKYGVAVKCCIRYGLPVETKAMIESEQNAILTAIKKANSFKHAINLPSRITGGNYDYTLAVVSGRRMR